MRLFAHYTNNLDKGSRFCCVCYLEQCALEIGSVAVARLEMSGCGASTWQAVVASCRTMLLVGHFSSLVQEGTCNALFTCIWQS